MLRTIDAGAPIPCAITLTNGRVLNVRSFATLRALNFVPARIHLLFRSVESLATINAERLNCWPVMMTDVFRLWVTRQAAHIPPHVVCVSFQESNLSFRCPNCYNIDLRPNHLPYLFGHRASLQITFLIESLHSTSALLHPPAFAGIRLRGSSRSSCFSGMLCRRS